MRTQEKPAVDKLFFENFFSPHEVFQVKHWRASHQEYFDKIQHSISSNVNDILNSINSLTVEDYLNKNLTFLEFGVPDFLTLYQTHNIGYDKIEQCIQHALQAFEPRLRNVSVKVELNGPNPMIVVKGRINKNESSFLEFVYHNIK